MDQGQVPESFFRVKEGPGLRSGLRFFNKEGGKACELYELWRNFGFWFMLGF